MHIPALLQFLKELSENNNRPWLLFGGFATVLFLAAPAAQAGTDGLAFMQEKGIKFYRIPRIAPPAGWEVDNKAGQYYGMLALAPSGKSFSSSESVIYARAIHEPKRKTTLDEHITSDIADFKGRDSKAQGISKDSILDQDMKAWRIVDFVYSEGSTTNYETVAYFDEGEYRFHLALSSRSKSEFEGNRPTFMSWVQSYRDIPDKDKPDKSKDTKSFEVKAK